MNAMFKTLIIAAALSAVLVGGPSSANADHNPYWRGYWGWYDNTYTPYYNNYYYSTPSYGYYGPSYGGYYGPSYGGYYGPSIQYNSGYYAPGVGVQIGGRRGVTFGWW